jgi:flagellar biosynthetic protein FliP
MANKERIRIALSALLPMLLFLMPGYAVAADISLPGISVQFGNNASGNTEVATAVKILLALTILSLAPAILIVTTSFTRIIVVLSMLRHAFGMQATPPNTVLISLALFLTLFSMMPSFRAIQAEAFQPFMDGKISSAEAVDKSLIQMRDFMVRQTREQDLALMVEVSGSEQPKTMEDIDTLLLIPAFMLSELKSAFQIGFVIFLPFLLIDIVVASILMSMGMLMVPPMMISLPIKILMFVLIDGWNLVVQSLMYSFA